MIFPAVIGVLLLLTGFWYVNDYYHSDGNVQEDMKNSDIVSVEEFRDGLYLDGPGEDTAGSGYPADDRKS